MTRKQFLKTTGLTAAAAIGGTIIYDETSRIMKGKHNYDQAFGLARSLAGEHSYQPIIEGRLPSEINGTLYRNGPGLFERDGYRKENILDGDGMVQAFHFRGGKVSYRNRFVRTSKWIDEEAAGKYLYNTWTTRRPGGVLKNALMQGKFKGQAGVTVRVINDKLYAFDESSMPYELDPETLETLSGEIDFGVQFENVNTLFAAHNKVDGRSGEWIQFGLENGIKAGIQVSIFDSRGKAKRWKRYELPIGTYMHDFFVTENYIIFNLQPAVMNPIAFILGLKSYVQSLSWKGERGSEFMVIHKSLQEAPIYLSTNSVFMWHSLNAFEVGDDIFCYFCGYNEPDHFLGTHAQTFEVMRNNNIHELEAKSPGSLRLARLNLKDGTLESEHITRDINRTYEFPVINENLTSYRNKYGYMVSGKMMGAFHHELNRINIETGKLENYDFGEGHYCGEPIFVGNDDHSEGSGWLMTLVFDEATDKSYLAVFNASAVPDGPIAKIHLNHHSPMSFHGTWNPA